MPFCFTGNFPLVFVVHTKNSNHGVQDVLNPIPLFKLSFSQTVDIRMGMRVGCHVIKSEKQKLSVKRVLNLVTFWLNFLLFFLPT